MGMTRRIVRNQRVHPTKIDRAKDLRTKPTQAEFILWQQLRRNQLDGFHFRRQQIIDGFIVDFFCNKVGLVVEVDGPIHEQQQAYDAERTAILQQRELTILRFTNDQILHQLPACLSQIRQQCHHLQKHHAESTTTPEPKSPPSSQEGGTGG